MLILAFLQVQDLGTNLWTTTVVVVLFNLIIQRLAYEKSLLAQIQLAILGIVMWRDGIVLLTN